jgi:hypothetical protein
MARAALGIVCDALRDDQHAGELLRPAQLGVKSKATSI